MLINYEKQVGQEAAYPIAYPIPISYNCYRHKKRYRDCYASRCTKIYRMGYAASCSTCFRIVARSQ